MKAEFLTAAAAAEVTELEKKAKEASWHSAYVYDWVVRVRYVAVDTLHGKS